MNKSNPVIVADFPLPAEQIHYADPLLNVQNCFLHALIDHVQYPTLGCPALVTPERALRIVVSLPPAVEAGDVAVTLIDRHGGGTEHRSQALQPPEFISLGPEGQRKLWLLRHDLHGTPHRLFDLHVSWPGGAEMQYNAVRVFAQITGTERVVFSGDSQYHVDNKVCLQRFIERLNADRDIAWVALAGDACDNGVRSPWNLIQLGASAHAGAPIVHYYEQEFLEVHVALRNLRHPIVIVPGNHDGMCAYDGYDTGQSTGIYLGPDPSNQVAYDGLHHFRRTFGPLYFHFDWGGTRYLAANSFELDRHHRLGYHAIIANWGGWMQDEQIGWLGRALAEADALKLRKVVIMHHDPRGGSVAKRLGHYNLLRQYTYTSRFELLQSYLGYLMSQGFRHFQQEWMMQPFVPLAQHPVQKLLRLLLDHQVFAVIMGHDNENWIESYQPDADIFDGQPPLVAFSTDEKPLPEELALARDAADLLADGDYGQVVGLLSSQSDEVKHRVLRLAVAQVKDRAGPPPSSYAVDALRNWRLRVTSPIHFVHVDDIGAYEYGREAQMNKYGYVVAELEAGAPRRLQGLCLGDRPPGTMTLLEGEQES